MTYNLPLYFIALLTVFELLIFIDPGLMYRSCDFSARNLALRQYLATSIQLLVFSIPKWLHPLFQSWVGWFLVISSSCFCIHYAALLWSLHFPRCCPEFVHFFYLRWLFNLYRLLVSSLKNLFCRKNLPISSYLQILCALTGICSFSFSPTAGYSQAYFAFYFCFIRFSFCIFLFVFVST